MTVYGFGDEFAQTYEKTCKCGRKIEVSTQKDDGPEYYSEIHVRCVCGAAVDFMLPVN